MGRGAGTPTLCGEFNAKNSFGGYFGFSPFFYRQGAEAAGILNPEIISDDYGITLDNVMKVESQAIIARNLESFGCIPTGLSQSLNKRIDQALGK
jgi:hypothetical protein